MTKIIIWIVVVFVVLFALRLINVAKAKRKANDLARRERAPPVQEMVRCVRCGTFLPRPDAKPYAGGFGCSDAMCARRG